MSPIQSEPGFYSGLSRIPKALRNEKALFVLLVSNLLVAALVFLHKYSHTESNVLSILLIFLMLLALPAGNSIAGLLLMDQAIGRKPRPLGRAVSDGVFAFLRILGISLAGVALTVVFYLALGLLLLVCKLPFVGPALYAVLFPVLVILAGLLLFGLLAGLSMAGPAIWSGATMREALSMVWRIATDHLAELLIGLLLLAILITVAEIILGSILFTGFWFVHGASAFVLSDSLRDATIGLPMPGTDNEYMLATIFGSLLGLALFLSTVSAMWLMGINLIFLRLTKNVAATRTQESVQTVAPQERWEKREPAIQPAFTENTTGTAPGISAPLFADPAPTPLACSLNPTLVISTPLFANPAPTPPSPNKPDVAAGSGEVDILAQILEGKRLGQEEPAPAIQSGPEPAKSGEPDILSSYFSDHAPTADPPAVPDEPAKSNEPDELAPFFSQAAPMSSAQNEPDILARILAEAEPPPAKGIAPAKGNEPTIMIIPCPNCRTASHPGDCFCGECGAKLQ